MSILISGGAGYIGSHTLIALSEAGYDNLSNSSKESIKRVEKIINKSFEEGDIRDKELLKKYNIDSVIHFAGLKAVEKPLEYYDNNVVGTLRLLEVMKEFGCKKIVFSSSATVYGNPIKEDFPVGGTTNPYGTSKYMIERFIYFKIAILIQLVLMKVKIQII